MKKLGFGLMRLPKINGEIDIEQVKSMADDFLSNGFTYFDTAYVYENSEVAFKEAVVKRYNRSDYYIADKLTAWKLKEGFDKEEIFKESLDRLGIEYIDYYLLHAVQEANIEIYNENDCWNFCQELKKKGLIKHFGFSFHGSPALLENILANHSEVEFVQLQINYLDWDNAIIASRHNYEICRRYHKNIIVMEPVKGGILANFDDDIAKLFEQYHQTSSFSSLALRYAGSLDGVIMVLSGMSNKEQVEDNINTFKDFVKLGDEEYELISKIKTKLIKKSSIGCTNCKYCVSECQKNILIPEIFKIYNQALIMGINNKYKEMYKNLINTTKSGQANTCIKCHRCEKVCPQRLKITDELAKASNYLDR